jgi:hypothetical protein
MDDKHQTTAPGPSIQFHTCNGTVAQDFTFESTAGATYQIVNQASSLCLDRQTVGDPVSQEPCTGGATQEWQVRAGEDGAYVIETPNGQSCLGVAADTSLITLTSCSDAQPFEITDAKGP